MPALFTGETASTGLSVVMILIKATIVLLAALAVTRAMERGSAVSRHLVWFVSLGALLLIPALASWSPLRLAILPASAGPSELGAPRNAPTIGAPSTIGPSSLPAATRERTADRCRGDSKYG